MNTVMDNDTSFLVLTTNPKLTTNIKLIVDSNDNLYLESFNANKQLNNFKFKNYKVSSNSSYNYDIYKFYNDGTFPIQLAYELYKESSDTDVLSSYNKQYEMFYKYGAEFITSEYYKENIGILAPLWLNKKIPKYFIIFKVKGPISIYENNYNNFAKNILAQGKIIKQFDLTKNSNIGNYILNYTNNAKFPSSSLNISFQKETMSYWNGISYKDGNFLSKGEFIYQYYCNTDTTITENDYFITKGFEKHGIICANLLNLQFLFDDSDYEEYTINRYYGLYVDDIVEGNFIINNEKISYNIDKKQIIYNYNSNQIEIENKNGISLYAKDTISNINDIIPNSDIVNNSTGVYYIKDKDSKFYNLKMFDNYNNDEIKLVETKIDYTKFYNFNYEMFLETKLLNSGSYSHLVITILKEIPNNTVISFYDINGLIIEQIVSKDSQISADEDPLFFYCKGNINNIAVNFAKCINTIDDEYRIFTAYAYNNNVIIKCDYMGEQYNKLSYDFNVLIREDIITINSAKYFIGGSSTNKYRVLINKDDINYIKNNLFIKTENKNKLYELLNTNNISNYIEDFSQLYYYNVLLLDNMPLIKNKHLFLYEELKLEYGKFSFYPIRDFDFSISTNEYNNTYTETNIETDFYKTDSEKNTHKNIIDFYNNGFINYQDINFSKTDKNEYDRLKEEFLSDISLISKAVPFICKYVYKNGKNIKQKEYRLNLSESFGLNNMSPSFDVKSQDSIYYTHEWYLMNLIPYYFYNNSNLKNIYSYFDKSINESLFTGIEFDSIEENFILNIIYNSLTDSTIVLDNIQIRYSIFTNGNEYNFPETFFNGAKIFLKERKENLIKLNYNLKDIAYIKNKKYNDYKFISLVIPYINDNSNNYKIKIIKNEKYKFIAFILNINIIYEDLNISQYDRTLLYSLKSKIKKNITTNDFSVLEYDNIKMNGAIDFVNTQYFDGYYIVKGMLDYDKNPTKFTQDININADGNYCKIKFTIGNDNYEISKIFKVIDDKTLYVGQIIKNNSYLSQFPLFSPNSQLLKKAEYTIEGGGYNIYQNLLNRVSFANIADDINNGNPDIEYLTIDINGNSITNNFMLEFIQPDLVLKPSYIKIEPEYNKNISFDNTVIGYNLNFETKIKIIPFFRYSGLYDIKFIDIIKFKDPYIEKTNTMSNYENKVFNYYKYLNTEFKIDSNFGIIKDMYFHKINIENFNNILNKNITHNYPLINEFALGKKDFNIFASNWENNYYLKQDNKNIQININGYEEQIEKKSFFGSKIITIPDNLDFYLFDSLNYTLEESTTQIILNVLFDDKITNFFYNKLISYFNLYISDKDHIDKYIDSYIRNNILVRYKISSLDFYTKEVKSKDKINSIYFMNIDNNTKLENNLVILNNYKIEKSNTLDFKIIFNKQLNYQYYIGLSINIIKK